MRVLVTGARGKVGRATVAALQEAGHDVRATDLAPPVFERPEEGDADYVQADLSEAGDAFAVVRGAEAVVHTAAIPEPTSNPPHVVFQNNLMATFNTLEAAIRFEVPRFVNTSRETVPSGARTSVASRSVLPGCSTRVTTSVTWGPWYATARN